MITMKTAYFLSLFFVLLAAPANESRAHNAAGSGENDKVWFFAMGHEKAPAFPGALRINQYSLYNDKAGYGWIHDGTRGEGQENLVARLLYKPNCGLPPDVISGCCVFWRGGKKPLTFRVNVPDGKYQIWVYSGMFSFNRFYDTVPFLIGTEGNDKASKDFKSRFFREFDDSYEYNPSWTVETIWEKYVRDQGASLYPMTGVAKDGRLDIEFKMPVAIDEVSQKSTGLLPINAIVICPISKLAEGEKEIARIEAERRGQFIKTTKLLPVKNDGAMPEIPSGLQGLGYIPYVRDFMKPIYPESVPRESEIAGNLSMFLAQGQREILSFAFYPLCDLKKVKVEVGPLKDDKGNMLTDSAVKLQWMRYMIQPLDYMRRTPEYRGVPLLMMDNKPLDYIKGMNRQYILSVTAPADAVPGVYRGVVTVTPAGEKSLSMQLEVKVYPFKLETYDDDDERIWLYYADNTYKMYGDALMTGEERWRRIDKDLAFMKQQLIAPTILFDYNASEEDLDKFMALYQKYGFKGYGVFGDYSLLGEVDGYYQGKKTAKPDITPFIAKMKEVLRLKQEKNWPDIAFYTFAEMKGGMPAYLAAKDVLAKIKKEIPRVVLMTLPNSIVEANAMINTEADIVGPNAVSMTESVTDKIHKLGKKLWFYGWGRQRFRCGLVDWRLGNRGAIKEWYSFTAAAPFNPIDGSSFDCWNDAPPFIGPDDPVSTLGMEEATQGRLDFFYLATLEKWIARAKAHQTPLAEKARLHAQAIIDDLKERIVPDYLYYYQRLKATDMKSNQFDVNKEQVFKWREDEYTIYRRKIADAIAALKDAVAGVDSVPATEIKPATTPATDRRSQAFTTSPTGALRLTDDDLIDSIPAWAPNGDMVSYVSKRKGGDKIVIINLHDQTARVLPVNIAKNTSYSWSPQSDKIASVGVDGTVSVIILKDDKVERLGPGSAPAFSPDGKSLAYFSGRDVLVYDFATGKAANASEQATEGALEKLSWSGDGKSIYYSKDGDIWVASLADGGNRLLLNHSEMGFSVPPALESPVLSPNGGKLFVTLNSDGLFAHVSNNQLAVYDFVDKKLKVISDANSWALSPEGARIIYGRGNQLMIYDVASGKTRKLIAGSEPAFSPKGDQVVYLYRKSMLEEPDVWITKAP